MMSFLFFIGKGVETSFSARPYQFIPEWTNSRGESRALENRSGGRKSKTVLTRISSIPLLTGNTLAGTFAPFPALKNKSIAYYSHIFQFGIGVSLLCHD